MNQLLLHHFKKDLRHARGWLLLTLLVSAGVLWFPTVSVDHRPDFTGWLMLFRYGGWVLLALTVCRLLLKDAPLRDTGFLRTKPVSPASLLGSKALVILAFIVPMALCECAMLLMIGLNPSAGGLVLIFAENLLSLTAIAAVAAAMVIRQKTTAGFQTSIILWCVVAFLGWIAAMWAGQWYRRHHKSDWSYSLEYLGLSRMLTVEILAAAGALVGIVLFIRSRRGTTVSAALAVTAICSIAAWYLWPVNFVEAAAKPMPEAPENEWPDQTKLKFSFTEQQDWDSETSKPAMKRFSHTDGGHSGTTYRQIRAHTRLEGLPTGWEAFTNAYRSALTLSDGRSLPSRRTAWGRLDGEVALPLVGIPSPWNRTPLSQVDLAEFRLPDAGGAATTARLKGEIEVPLHRPVILARIPLRKGSTARFRDSLLHITRAEAVEGKIDFEIVVETPLIHSRGGFFAGGPTLNFDVLAIHSARKEFLQNGSGSQSNRNFGHYIIQNQRFENQQLPAALRKREKSTLLPPGWLDGAELLIVGSETGGTFHQSFDFSDAPLDDQ